MNKVGIYLFIYFLFTPVPHTSLGILEVPRYQQLFRRRFTVSTLELASALFVEYGERL